MLISPNQSLFSCDCGIPSANCLQCHSPVPITPISMSITRINTGFPSLLLIFPVFRSRIPVAPYSFLTPARSYHGSQKSDESAQCLKSGHRYRFPCQKQLQNFNRQRSTGTDQHRISHLLKSPGQHREQKPKRNKHQNVPKKFSGLLPMSRSTCPGIRLICPPSQRKSKYRRNCHGKRPLSSPLPKTVCCLILQCHRLMRRSQIHFKYCKIYRPGPRFPAADTSIHFLT